METIENKEELLNKYKSKEVTKHIQYDAFYDPEHIDNVVGSDIDGDCIMWGETCELMNGGVRVLINSKLMNDTKRIVRQLHKIANLIEREGAENE